MIVVPLGESGSHVHLLDDVAPAYARVVGAEGNFTFLSGVRDDALLCTAEVVVEQILEPHSSDEEEVPTIATADFNVGHRALAGYLTVALASGTHRLVELLEQVRNAEVGGGGVGVVVSDQCK